MSRPYALPVGPTRFADKITSMPPPEPRSSTTSPGCNLARAVGLPQPSEAATAFSGKAPFSASLYKSLVMGSQPLSSAPPLQQLEPPLAARLAASPYFCFTASWMFDSLMLFLILKFESPIPPARLETVCSTPRKENSRLRATRRYPPCTGETCSLVSLSLAPPASASPGGEIAWMPGCPTLPALRRRPCHRGERRGASGEFAGAVRRRERKSGQLSG